MSKLQRLAPFLLLALAPVAAVADDYRFEVQGRVDRDLPSFDGVADFDTLNLSGTWFFSPVSTEGVPLSEAAFLGRASSLSAVAARFEWQFASVDTHLNAQAANVAYYIPGTMFYAGLGVSHAQNVTAISSTIIQKEYATEWFGRLGIAPLKGLLITTELKEHGYDPNISARYVGKLPNEHFYAGGVSLIDPDGGDTSFGLDFDYYFNDAFSLGAGFEDARDEWELRAEKFFSKSWALGATASTSDFGDGFGISVTWRH